MWLRNMRGLRVIKDGRCIGRVVQGCLCDSLTMLDGFWADRMLFGIRFISSEHICVLGKSSILVDHPGERLRMKPQTLFIRSVSTDGKRFGAVIDAEIDERTYRVNRLAVNTGWFDRLTHGLLLVSGFTYDHASARVIIGQYETETEVET